MYLILEEEKFVSLWINLSLAKNRKRNNSFPKKFKLFWKLPFYPKKSFKMQKNIWIVWTALLAVLTAPIKLFFYAFMWPRHGEKRLFLTLFCECKIRWRCLRCLGGIPTAKKTQIRFRYLINIKRRVMKTSQFKGLSHEMEGGIKVASIQRSL